METWQYTLGKWIGVLYLNWSIWVICEFLNELVTCLTKCNISNNLMLSFEQPYILHLCTWESEHMISRVVSSTCTWNHLYRIPFAYGSVRYGFTCITCPLHMNLKRHYDQFSKHSQITWQKYRDWKINLMAKVNGLRGSIV